MNRVWSTLAVVWVLLEGISALAAAVVLAFSTAIGTALAYEKCVRVFGNGYIGHSGQLDQMFYALIAAAVAFLLGAAVAGCAVYVGLEALGIVREGSGPRSAPRDARAVFLESAWVGAVALVGGGALGGLARLFGGPDWPGEFAGGAGGFLAVLALMTWRLAQRRSRARPANRVESSLLP